MLSTIALVAEIAPVTLIFPNWVFPVIAAAAFVALGFVVWSFRDVANRHSHKVKGSVHAHGTDHH